MKDKLIIIEVNFEKIGKAVKNSTAKPRNLSLWIFQKLLETLSVYIKERLTLYKDFNFFLLSQTDPLKCILMIRLINGLFHSRYLDFDANEKIILKPALSE